MAAVFIEAITSVVSPGVSVPLVDESVTQLWAALALQLREVVPVSVRV